jgi:hypothetical protein
MHNANAQWVNQNAVKCNNFQIWYYLEQLHYDTQRRQKDLDTTHTQLRKHVLNIPHQDESPLGVLK